MNDPTVNSSAQPSGVSRTGDEQCRLLLAATPVSVVSNIVTAVIVAWILVRDVAGAVVWAWMAGFAALHGARLVYWMRHRGALEAIELPLRMHRVLRGGAALAGAAWGVIPLLLFPQDPLLQTIIAFVVAGVSGAAVAGMAFDGWSALLFILAAAVPMGVRLATGPTALAHAMSVLVWIYLIYLAAAIRRGLRQFVVSHRWRNQALRSAARFEMQNERLERLVEFNTLRSKVNQVIASGDDEAALLQAICDLSVRLGRFRLAWIGRPDASGRFEFLARSGAVGYMEGLAIGTDRTEPEGRGPATTTWVDRRACFDADLEAVLAGTRREGFAREYGIRSTATLPIRRDGAMFAVFAVYHGDSGVFDEDLRALLEDLAGDITHGLDRLATRQRERRLRLDLESARQFERSLFEKNAAAMYLVDAGGSVRDVNPALSAITGFAPTDLIGRSVALLHGDAAATALPLPRPAQAPGAGQDHDALPLLRKNGERGLARVVTASVELPDGAHGRLVSLIDVTELQRANERVRYQATHDALTGLANRFALEQFLPLAVERARRQGAAFAVGMLDLDDFKIINDSYGHDAGDKVLKEFARRLGACLRRSDLLARMGGDEFVLVSEDIDAAQPAQQLAVLFERLHRAVEVPFDIVPGVEQTLEMTMGVAVFPVDAEDGDALVRKADAAMYESKLHKHDRQHWWRIGTSGLQDASIEGPFDAYGAEAVVLLDKARDHLLAVNHQFAALFSGELARQPHAAQVLAGLTGDEQARLQRRLLARLESIFSPLASREAIEQRAREVGTVHALVGVSPALLVEAVARYRLAVSRYLNTVLMPNRERYRLVLIADTRMQDDGQAQLDAQAAVTNLYLGAVSEPLPQPGELWADINRREIDLLARLPGMRGVLLMRLTSSGVFAVERSSGPGSAEIAAVLSTPGSEAVVDPGSPRGQGLSAVAWRSREIQSVAAYDKDPRYAAWRTPARQLGIRSTLSVPVRDANGVVVAVISFFGAYPNQFESVLMRQFARGVQQRWEEVWARANTAAPVVQERHAGVLRDRLFGGGLRMDVQPVVDLRSGQVVRVEALARLVLDDGSVIPPRQFLPLLGDAELDRVFRLGLDQALEQLVAWEAKDLQLDLSVNLAPATLLDPDCPAWVGQALRRHGVAPHRLSLELLETESIDAASQDEAIDQLVRLGVKLAMDDLGSGYSSLQRLSTLPFDTIKVDQSLTLNLRRDPLLSLSLIRAIIQLGRDLGRQVVVEGLEDAGMVEAAVILGAVQGQGYALARPMRADLLPEWADAFRLDVEAGQVRTFLGALAYHWLHAQSALPESAVPLKSCPVTRFLDAQGLDDAPVARWHRQCHAEPFDHEASHKVTAWLVDRVRSESATAGGLPTGAAADRR